MRLLSTVRLNDNQKRVLAKIAAAPTPTVAGEEISKEPNLVAARNMMMKLGIITFVDNKAEITDKGQHLGKEENILDDSGGLTDVGNKLAFTKSTGQPDGDQAPDGAPPAGEMPPADPMGGMDMGGEETDDWGGEPATDDQMAAAEDDPFAVKGESFALLKQLLS